MRTPRALFLACLLILAVFEASSLAQANGGDPLICDTYAGTDAVEVGVTYQGNCVIVSVSTCNRDGSTSVGVGVGNLHSCAGVCYVNGSPGVYFHDNGLTTCVPAPTGVASCAVAGGYPGQTGVVIQNADGSKTAECFAPASPAQCSLAGYVWDNTLVCAGTCRDASPGAGWTVGASLGATDGCVAAPWVAVYPAFPGCPPAATVGVVVYDAAGHPIFSACF
jgi:hypothetical protein